MVRFLISLDITDVQQCIVTNADTANPVGSATYLFLYGFLVSAVFAYGFLLWQMRRARISLRNEVLLVLDMRLQELRDTCLQLRDMLINAGWSARQRSDDSTALLAHVTGWQLHAHHAQLDRLERYVIADFYKSAPMEQPVDEEPFSGTGFRISLSPPR